MLSRFSSYIAICTHSYVVLHSYLSLLMTRVKVALGGVCLHKWHSDDSFSLVILLSSGSKHEVVGL